jgi:BolA family transcriptional regulator, general stress-responsive regulator
MMFRLEKTRPPWSDITEFNGTCDDSIKQEADLSQQTIANTITIKLTQAFAPEKLEVIDESHLHAGHSGARPEGETHFRVVIISKKFAQQNLVARHRMVNEVLSDELKGRVHALAISASPPDNQAQ